MRQCRTGLLQLLLLLLLLLPPMLGKDVLYEVLPAALCEISAGLREMQEMHAHKAPSLGCAALGCEALAGRLRHGHICPGSSSKRC